MKKPVAVPRAGQKQRPAFLADQFQPVCMLAGQPHLDVARIALRRDVAATGGDGVLDVTAAQKDASVRPRMVMQRAIVVAAQEKVQVDIEETIARDYEPPKHVRLIVSANNDIRGATTRHTLLKERE